MLLKKVRVQPRHSTVNVILPAFAAERRRPLVIDISYPRGAQLQTRHALYPYTLLY